MQVPLKNTTEVAYIDDEDYHLLENYRWRASQSPHENKPYIRGFYSGIVPYGMHWQVLLHRLVMHAGKGDVVTFVDRNPFNCRKENLRFASRSICVSRQKPKHKYKNVSNNGVDNWVAKFQDNGRCKRLSGYLTAKDAAHAYDLYVLKYIGSELASLNFPEEIYKTGNYTLNMGDPKTTSGYWGVASSKYNSYTSLVYWQGNTISVGGFKDIRNAAICRDWYHRRLNIDSDKINYRDIDMIPTESTTYGVTPQCKKYAALAQGKYCGTYDTVVQAAVAHDKWIMQIGIRSCPKLNYPGDYGDILIQRIKDKVYVLQ